MTQTIDRPIVFHDFGGHAFTAQIARKLAARGRNTVYLSFSGFGTPKGRVLGETGDPPHFRAEQIAISRPFEKDNLWARRRQQIEYGRLAAAWVLRNRPGIVVSSNCPLEVQQAVQSACRKVGARFIFWLQDIHAESIKRILARKSKAVGSLAGAYYQRLEARLLLESDAVIAIARDFVDLLGSGWGIDTAHVQIIENWAPLEDLPLHARDNDVAERLFRPERKRVVYSGTLSRKHNPQLLPDLARSLDVDVHLFSEGSAAEQVCARAATEGLHNVFVHPWVTVEALPKVLAGADMVCALLEEDVGRFSVPSKVLTYLAVGRPIVASIPLENLAARTIVGAKAGLVADTGDAASFVHAARRLLENQALRDEMGANGRAYAERVFDMDVISDKFIACFERVEIAPRVWGPAPAMEAMRPANAP